MPDLFEQMANHLYDGDASEVAQLVTQALEENVAAEHILKNGLIKGMDRVGVDFKNGDLFVPEVLIAARAMDAGMKILRPVLVAADVKSEGKFVIGTVKGDLHDIGKNLVKMMMEGAGFEVVDLGTDVSPAGFVQAVETHQPKIIGMSALLTTTMVQMRSIIEALEQAGLRDSLKIMVGGAPLTNSYAKEIGADAYAPDAASAVETARNLVANG